jgi:hypothetical protein
VIALALRVFGAAWCLFWLTQMGWLFERPIGALLFGLFIMLGVGIIVVSDEVAP